MATNITPLASEAKLLKELGTTDVNRVRTAVEDFLLSIVALFCIAVVFCIFLFVVLPWLAIDSSSGQ